MSCLLFTQKRGLKGIGSRIIETFTWSDWSHVDIVHEGRALGALPWHGVIERSVDEVISHASKFMIVVTDADEDRVWWWARSQLGKPYDWSGIVGIGLHRDWDAQDRWFCSEFVEWAHRQASWPLISTRKKLDRITPQDLYESEMVRLPGRRRTQSVITD